MSDTIKPRNSLITRFYKSKYKREEYKSDENILKNIDLTFLLESMNSEIVKLSINNSNKDYYYSNYKVLDIITSRKTLVNAYFNSMRSIDLDIHIDTVLKYIEYIDIPALISKYHYTLEQLKVITNKHLELKVNILNINGNFNKETFDEIETFVDLLLSGKLDKKNINHGKMVTTFLSLDREFFRGVIIHQNIPFRSIECISAFFPVQDEIIESKTISLIRKLKILNETAYLLCSHNTWKEFSIVFERYINRFYLQLSLSRNFRMNIDSFIFDYIDRLDPPKTIYSAKYHKKVSDYILNLINWLYDNSQQLIDIECVYSLELCLDILKTNKFPDLALDEKVVYKSLELYKRYLNLSHTDKIITISDLKSYGVPDGILSVFKLGVKNIHSDVLDLI